MTLQPTTGWKTWDQKGERCNHCCNKDRCDDPDHFDRSSQPGCPHCLNTGLALWKPDVWAKYRESKS